VNRRERKEAIKAQRRELRARLAEQRARLAEARSQRPKKTSKKVKRRLALLILLLLLLLLRRCECEEPPPMPPPPPKEEVTETATKTPPKKKAKKKKRKPMRARTKKRSRPAYEGAPTRKATWVDAFRLEVSGRSLRLSSCFEGAQRPGAVKWSASIDPATGEVSDQIFAPVASELALSNAQTECLEGVLADPPYRLRADDGKATPQRVALVLEF